MLNRRLIHSVRGQFLPEVFKSRDEDVDVGQARSTGQLHVTTHMMKRYIQEILHPFFHEKLELIFAVSHQRSSRDTTSSVPSPGSGVGVGCGLALLFFRMVM